MGGVVPRGVPATPRHPAKPADQGPPLLSRLPWLMRSRVPALPWMAGIRAPASCSSRARRAASVDWNPSPPTCPPWEDASSHGLGWRACSCLASSTLRVLRSACLGVTFFAGDLAAFVARLAVAPFFAAFFVAFFAVFLAVLLAVDAADVSLRTAVRPSRRSDRSEEHTSELQSRENLVCRLLFE